MIYSKKELDSMITNRTRRGAKFDLELVPKELASEWLIDFENGFVLADTEFVKDTNHRISDSYIIKKISEEYPEIFIAANETLINGVALSSIISNEHMRKNSFHKQIHTNSYCESCSS